MCFLNVSIEMMAKLLVLKSENLVQGQTLNVLSTKIILIISANKKYIYLQTFKTLICLDRDVKIYFHDNNDWFLDQILFESWFLI